MVTRVSSIESHPQRAEIIAALAAEQPYREIAKWSKPTVTIGTLSRFKSRTLQNLFANVSKANEAIANGMTRPEDVQSVTRAAMHVAIDPFCSRISQHAATIDNAIDDAKTLREGRMDGRTIASLISTDLKGLELKARLEGRLDNVTVLNTVVVLPAPTTGGPIPGGPHAHTHAHASTAAGIDGADHDRTSAHPSDWDGITLDIKLSK